MSKFQFILRTQHDAGKTSETMLTETDNRTRATMLRHRIATLAGGLIRERTCKRVKVLKVDVTRFNVFAIVPNPPRKGQIFNSIDALAEAMSANPVTLRAALSIARKDTVKEKSVSATVRGVTFTYVA